MHLPLIKLSPKSDIEIILNLEKRCRDLWLDLLKFKDEKAPSFEQSEIQDHW